MESAEADMRPLGALALGAAALSVALSWTYFFSTYALLAAVVALPLGVMSRSHERSRGMGNAAIGLAVFALVVACATLIMV